MVDTGIKILQEYLCNYTNGNALLGLAGILRKACEAGGTEYT